MSRTLRRNQQRPLGKKDKQDQDASETIKAPKNWNKLKIAEKYNKVVSSFWGLVDGKGASNSFLCAVKFPFL